MARIEQSITVNVPLKTAYNQWTQFEDFPEFMDGIEHVEQLDDRRLRWTANIAGKEETWDAEIYQQLQDEKIAWRATSGADNEGEVYFRRIDDDQCEVLLTLDYEPHGVIQAAGDLLGFVRRRVEGDLKRFKAFIESRGRETGGWRGDIEFGQVHRP
jgi:uncharacterized membrane protein